MITVFEIIPSDPLASIVTDRVDWPRAPSLEQIKSLIMPHLHAVRPRCDFEHVSVWSRDTKPQQRDMFVDDMGLVFNLPRNERATSIYHRAWLARFPDADPTVLSPIVGVAIWFPERRVWY